MNGNFEIISISNNGIFSDIAINICSEKLKGGVITKAFVGDVYLSYKFYGTDQWINSIISSDLLRNLSPQDIYFKFHNDFDDKIFVHSLRFHEFFDDNNMCLIIYDLDQTGKTHLLLGVIDGSGYVGHDTMDKEEFKASLLNLALRVSGCATEPELQTYLKLGYCSAPDELLISSA